VYIECISYVEAGVGSYLFQLADMIGLEGIETRENTGILRRGNWHSPATLTEVFLCFFLSCKANARV
jgi:hypothetical protein